MVRLRVLAEARSAAGMVAVRAVALWKVVAIGVPFSSTTELVINPVPVMEMETGEALNEMVLGEIDAMLMGA